MSKTFKIVLILLVVASITSASLAVISFLSKEREYMKRILLEDKLAATLKDKKGLEEELNLNKKFKEESETKIEELSGKIKTLSLQIEEEKEKGSSAVLDLASKKKEAEDLKSDLEKEKKEKLSISKKLDELAFDYEKAKRDVSRLKEEKARLEKDIADLREESVELDKIVVSPSADIVSFPQVTSPKELLRGRVLVVNKDYSFVVTDLGQDDEVKKDIVFEIRDGSNFLGKVKIDKVYDTMSSAVTLPGTNINNIKKGNLVIESR